MLQRAYDRLGPRYPRAMLGVALRIEHLVLLVGLAVLTLYVNVTIGQFAIQQVR